MYFYSEIREDTIDLRKPYSDPKFRLTYFLLRLHQKLCELPIHMLGAPYQQLGKLE